MLANDKMKEINDYIFFANSSITLDWNHCCSHSNKRFYTLLNIKSWFLEYEKVFIKLKGALHKYQQEPTFTINGSPSNDNKR